MLRKSLHLVKTPATRLYSSSAPTLAKILASDSIEKVCGDVFRARGHELVEMPGIKKDELIKIIGDYEGLVVRSGTKVTKEIMDAGLKLKIIGRAGTGVDNIDVTTATNKGILVVNTPGGNTISTGELALSHILSLARNIPQATASLKAGRWDRAIRLFEQGLESDNLSEETYRQIIRCHLAQGHFAEAIRAYHRCRELLAMVLGVAPSAETLALYQHALRENVGDAAL